MAQGFVMMGIEVDGAAQAFLCVTVFLALLAQQAEQEMRFGGVRSKRKAGPAGLACFIDGAFVGKAVRLFEKLYGILAAFFRLRGRRRRGKLCRTRLARKRRQAWR